MPTPSGATWVSQFPGSTSTADLETTFQANYLAFQSAMAAAGLTVSISSTLRPPKRAYLMHYSWRIAKGNILAADVPAMTGVDIQWDHANAVAGAQEMVDGYGTGSITVAPALTSRHTEGKAVDTRISWSGNRTIAKQDGTSVTLSGAPRDSTHPTLIEVGATYDVIHFTNVAADPFHWSTDGR